MKEALTSIYSDPVLGKLLLVLLGSLLIVATIAIIKMSLFRYIKDQEYLYKTKKIINLIGWMAVIFFVMIIYNDKLGGVKGDVIDFSVMRTTIMEVDEWVNGDLYNG